MIAPLRRRKRDAMRMLATTVAILALSAASALAECTYRQQFFSAGDVSCQGGMQYRCDAGSWKATGLDCADTQGNEEGLRVDPSRQAPKVRERPVEQPPSPANPHD